jgi:hypothetical protein
MQLIHFLANCGLSASLRGECIPTGNIFLWKAFISPEKVSIFVAKIKYSKMKIAKFRNLLFPLSIFIVTGCMTEGPWEKKEQADIADYIKKNSDYVLKPSGLFYFNITEGTGRAPVVNDTVSFNYVGRFLNGVAFDSVSTVKAPVRYVIGTGLVVAGVDEGLRYMKAGGKSKLLTPSSLAYGQKGVYTVIPGYSPLLWYIDLIDVIPGPGK